MYVCEISKSFNQPSEHATSVQRLPNVFQNSKDQYYAARYDFFVVVVLLFYAHGKSVNI